MVAGSQGERGCGMSQRYKDPAVSQWTWLKPSELWPRGPMVSGPWDNLLHLSPLKLSGASALLTPTSAPRKVGGVVPCPRLPLCSLPCSQQLQRTRPGLGRGWERQEGETESGSSCSSPVLCLARIPRIGSRGTHPSLNVSTQTHSRREIELYFCVDGFVDNEELARTWISDSTAVELGFRDFAHSPLVCFSPCIGVGAPQARDHILPQKTGMVKLSLLLPARKSAAPRSEASLGRRLR